MKSDSTALDLETAVQRFLELAESLQRLPVLRAADVLEKVLAFYRETRITGATLEQDGDMLLLQWGIQNQLLLLEPTDLRNSGDTPLKYTQEPRQYLDLTRQLHITALDFDNSAIQLSLTLVYDPARGDEDSSNLWIPTPSQIEEKLSEFHAEPAIAAYMENPPQRLVATVISPG